jgi:hypothetical protein
MILRATTMNNPAIPPPEPVLIILARKLVLLGLLMVVAALGLQWLLRQILIGSLLLPHILSDALMGLMAGFSVRWFLRKQTSFLRVSSAMVFLIGGLELLGWFTGWQIGLGPLRIGLSHVDWYSLGQLFLGTGIALLALYAWTQPSPDTVTPLAESLATQSLSLPRQKHKKRPPHSTRSAAPAMQSEQAVKPKRKHNVQHRHKLQLSEEEEHRCPYCLELITPDDLRGTVECKICHTLHHSDCWTITGVCQVPHYTS